VPGDPLLAPGPFTVGFRSTWGFDEERTYCTAFDGGRTYGAEKSPRPVLVLQWYPARDAHGEPMAHGTYFSIADDNPRLERFAEVLSAYARTMFAMYVMDTPEAEIDDAGRAEINGTLAEPTLCVAAAEPAAGPFPLVVYHGGLGSSFEDNAALCAYLASHGYVVLGSAFPRADGRSLNIDAFHGSAEDMQFLVRWAHAQAFIDVRRVGLVGHSAGAQAMLRFAAQPECVGDALVLLDTTQDYYPLGIPFFEPLVREVTGGMATLTKPMLVAANPAAMFALCDTLVNAERIYVTVPELEHNDFISQGQQRLARIARSPDAGPAEAAKVELARANYRALCECVLQFLDATLRGRQELAALLTSTPSWSPTAPCLVHVPRNASAPEPYDLSSDAPPTPRQFVRLLMRPGIEEACLALERFHESAPHSPMYTDTRLAGSMLYQMLEDGRHDDAARYYAVLQEMPLDVLRWFAETSEDEDEREQALHFLNMAHHLDPDDADIAAKLRSIQVS
jgi:pimeloyl-ACP methyl ester carboxylesterase